MVNLTTSNPWDDISEEYSFVLRFWYVFIEPWFLFGGVLGNLLILCVMPMNLVTIRASLKMYYIIIAISDLYNIINSWILWTFIYDTLSILTNGHIYFDLSVKSEFACKEIFTGWAAAEILSNYTLVSLLIEKILVVTYPLKAKTFLNERTRCLIFALCVFPPFFSVVPFNPFVVMIMKPKFMKKHDYCYYDDGHPLYQYVFWTTHVFMFGVHEMLSLALSTALICKLLHQSHKRKKLMQCHLTEAKEWGTIVTIVTLAMINFFCFIPVTILTSFFFMVDLNMYSKEVNDVLNSVWRLTYQAVVITHAINFPVYLNRIASFRRVFTQFFTGCLNAHLKCT